MPRTPKSGKTPKAVKAWAIYDPKGKMVGIAKFQYNAWEQAEENFIIGKFEETFLQYKRQMIRAQYRCIHVLITPIK